MLVSSLTVFCVAFFDKRIIFALKNEAKWSNIKLLDVHDLRLRSGYFPRINRSLNIVPVSPLVYTYSQVVRTTCEFPSECSIHRL